jgi:hypothetical protein
MDQRLQDLQDRVVRLENKAAILEIKGKFVMRP